MGLLALFELAVVLLLIAPSSAAPAKSFPRASSPAVKLDSATFVGKTDGDIERFLGIPFAKPPVGNLRFRLPVATEPYTGTYTATSFGPSCPQQAPDLPLSGLVDDVADEVLGSIYGAIFPGDEDCLTINVVRPKGASSTSKLPVVVWIFGGGFQLGTPTMYDGGLIVGRSIDMSLPVVYVSINYRVSLFGFLAGKEVKQAGVGNLGLHDQRLGLRWVQKYITQFGGDPTKVTLWGESAGAISTALQMVTNGGNTEGLFRAAFMQSGAAVPVGDITLGQEAYDAVVASVGCTKASDTLQCLRTVPYSALKKAMDESPGIFHYKSLALTWLPRVDGVFLTESPFEAVAKGKVASIPYVTGDLDDEGTLFSLSTLNITKDADVHKWFQTSFLGKSTTQEIDKLLSLYPSDITAGSPYDTSVLNALTPQFKRIASLQGDLVFQAPRRHFLQNTWKNNAWAFLSKRGKAIPFLGSFHGSDILNVYGFGELKDYLIRFATNLDPNVGPFSLSLISWPKWTPTEKKMLLLDDVPIFDLGLTQDTYRQEAITYITSLSLKYPL
ncbi:hypothetical protein FRC03_000099 [Tulasnella sp. 419]|nr:hypothetical protein FRC03_000099 [Tulasnella sp. 419]